MIADFPGYFGVTKTTAQPSLPFTLNVRWMCACAATCFHPGTCSFIRELIRSFKRCYTTFPDNLLGCFFSNVCVCQTIKILFKPCQTFSFTYQKTFISQFYQCISRICNIFSYVYIFFSINSNLWHFKHIQVETILNGNETDLLIRLKGSYKD